MTESDLQAILSRNRKRRERGGESDQISADGEIWTVGAEDDIDALVKYVQSLWAAIVDRNSWIMSPISLRTVYDSALKPCVWGKCGKSWEDPRHSHAVTWQCDGGHQPDYACHRYTCAPHGQGASIDDFGRSVCGKCALDWVIDHQTDGMLSIAVDEK